MLKWFIIGFIILLFIIIVSVLIWYSFNFKSTPFKEHKPHIETTPPKLRKININLFKLFNLISDIIISIVVCLAFYLYFAVYGLFIDFLPIVLVSLLFVALLIKSIIKFLK